ncbi:hypothetical protein RYX36_007460, partial [Vicia faba]
MDASKRFSDYFSGMSMLSEHGFVLDNQEDNFGFLVDIGTMIRAKRWMMFCQQPLSYNTQLVKMIYANLADTNNIRAEVVIGGVSISYSDGRINMLFGLNTIEDRYQELLEALNDGDFEVYMESLCNMGTRWLEFG